jgi:hypothetical protein
MMKKEQSCMPDMEGIASQMEEAMAQAKQAMADLPGQMEGMEKAMGSLSALMGGMDGQMEELGSAMAGFGQQHAANVESLAGQPDWSVEATIRVGEKLEVIVTAAFDLQKVKEAWSSTQGAEFESLVQETVAGTGDDVDAGQMELIIGQLKKGRSVALVQSVDVVSCRIQGAPPNAAAELQLSPEGNIPLAMGEGGLAFELAPVLTIRNRWENAEVPTFTPMAEELVVPLSDFDSAKGFSRQFEVSGQEEQIGVELAFNPLD